MTSAGWTGVWNLLTITMQIRQALPPDGQLPTPFSQSMPMPPDDLLSLYAESRALLAQSRRLRSLCEQARIEAAELRARSRAVRSGGVPPPDRVPSWPSSPSP
jgi:hypothetical protein